MPKPVYEEGDVTVLWNQAVHREHKNTRNSVKKKVHREREREREVTANRPDIIIKNKKEKT